MAIQKLLFISRAAMFEFSRLRRYMLPRPPDSMGSCSNIYSQFNCELLLENYYLNSETITYHVNEYHSDPYLIRNSTVKSSIMYCDYD